MAVALDPNNSNFRPGLNPQEERTPIHTARADQSSHVSSIESLSDRRDCDDGCGENSCCETIGMMLGVIAVVVFVLPIVLFARFCVWAYDGITSLFYPNYEPVVAPDLSNLEQEVIDTGSHYRINVPKRGQAPDRIDWNAVLNGRDINQVQVAELLDCFDEVYGRDPSQTNFDDITVDQRASLRNSISGYVDFINARDLDCASETTAEYYDQITLFVKNIILELKKPEISAERKQNVFSELADAAGNCCPRRIEEALRQFRYITNRPDTIDNRVREWAQGYKEDIILRHFQNTQFHVLNHARTVVTGWGLEQPDALNGRDGISFVFGSSRYTYLEKLHENYSPAHLISMVQTKIIFFEENDLVNEYLATEYAREGSPLYGDDDMLGRIFEHKTLDDGREVSEITTFGTAKLLELLGFIDPIQSS